jgi:hypothetical protein
MLFDSSMASLRALVFGCSRGRSARSRRRPTRSRPGLESLEDRLAPTAQVYLDSNGLLHINSDNTGNTIRLSHYPYSVVPPEYYSINVVKLRG